MVVFCVFDVTISMTLQPGAGVKEHILSPIFHIHTQRHTYMRAHNPCPHILFMHFRGADAGISYTGGSSHSFHYTHTHTHIFRGADAGISYTGGSSHSFHYTYIYVWARACSDLLFPRSKPQVCFHLPNWNEGELTALLLSSTNI